MDEETYIYWIDEEKLKNLGSRRISGRGGDQRERGDESNLEIIPISSFYGCYRVIRNNLISPVLFYHFFI